MDTTETPHGRTLSDAQTRVGAFVRAHGLAKEPAFAALDLVAEVGEVVKEILSATEYGRRPYPGRAGTPADPSLRARVEGELGDALYSLLDLANALGVDAPAALDGALAKYARRIAARGRPASS